MNWNRRAKRNALLALRDAALLAVALLLFAAVHHGLPVQQQSLGTLAAAQAQNPLAEQGERSTVVHLARQSEENVQPVTTPAPTGDFSVVFPAYDTGIGADWSYQSETLRIAITRVENREEDLTYYLADVYVRNLQSFRTAFAGGAFVRGKHVYPTEMAEENNAVLAVTGDYCGARAKGLVIRNGELYRDSAYKDICVLFADGTMETYPADAFQLETVRKREAVQAWSFGPYLVRGGVARENYEGTLARRHPRCAIGYYEPGHYCMIVVDGRQKGYSQGIRLVTLASLFSSLGCREAYNLDGGATAMMLFRGEVISKPTGGGRESGDILYFYETGA